MPVDSKHKEYPAYAEKVGVVDDFIDVDEVKAKKAVYLPKTITVANDENDAKEAGINFDPYQLYIDHAHVSSIVFNTLVESIGFAFKEPPKIELPKKLEHLLAHADGKGNSLITVFQNIVETILKQKRCAIASDWDNDSKESKISLYSGLSLINWDMLENPKFLMLQEQYVKDSSDIYDIEYATQLKELRITEGKLEIKEHRQIDDGGAWAEVGDTAQMMLAKKESFDFIPVQIADISEIPLYPQTREVLAAYRWSASHGNALHYLGEPQQVQEGDEPSNQEKKGSSWTLFVEKGGKIYYLELNPEAMEPLRKKIEDHLKAAADMGVKLITDTSHQQSGESLYIQSKHRQSNLISVVREAGTKLEAALRVCAKIEGVEPEEVIFEPDLDFIKKPVDTAKLDHLSKSVKEGSGLVALYAQALRDAGWSVLSDEEYATALLKQKTDDEARIAASVNSSIDATH